MAEDLFFGKLDRTSALQVGALYDITDIAKHEGFGIPIDVSPTLWNILANEDINVGQTRVARTQYLLQMLKKLTYNEDNGPPGASFQAVFYNPQQQNFDEFTLYAILQSDPDHDYVMSIWMEGDFL